MPCLEFRRVLDRKSTRLNSSHTLISYAVFCLKKKSVGSEEHTSELQSHSHIVCRLLLGKKKSAPLSAAVPGFVLIVGAGARNLLFVILRRRHGLGHFFFKGSGDHRNLPSCPTRLPSD